MLEKRCAEIGIKLLFQGISDKISKLREIVGDTSLSSVAYIGDDLNDLKCMLQIQIEGGYIGCPSDAINEIKSIADFQSSKTGGNGAVREFIEEIIIKVLQRVLPWKKLLMKTWKCKRSFTFIEK